MSKRQKGSKRKCITSHNLQLTHAQTDPLILSPEAGRQSDLPLALAPHRGLGGGVEVPRGETLLARSMKVNEKDPSVLQSPDSINV